jgi:hypothetical protein
MKRLIAFARLSKRDRKLLLLATIYLIACSLKLRTQSFGKIQIWATRRHSDKAPLHRLIWAVKVATNIVPGATCLTQALALQKLLSKNNLTSELGIGVGKLDDQFRAHAWLTHKGDVLIGEAELEKYTMLRQTAFDRAESPNTN